MRPRQRRSVGSLHFEGNETRDAVKLGETPSLSGRSAVLKGSLDYLARLVVEAQAGERLRFHSLEDSLEQCEAGLPQQMHASA